jgi:hypothetical protein
MGAVGSADTKQSRHGRAEKRRKNEITAVVGGRQTGRVIGDKTCPQLPNERRYLIGKSWAVAVLRRLE